MNRIERDLLMLARRTLLKERKLDERLRSVKMLQRERAGVNRKHKAMIRGAVQLREYILARGTEATFSDVVEGLDLLIKGQPMPRHYRTAGNNTRRKRQHAQSVAR